MIQIPTATYRIQFSPQFGFRQARALVAYLHDLGISHIYASPIFKARKGSGHGYDVVDPNQLNPELGTIASFEALMRALKKRGMGWLQDIVPNHMAYDAANGWLADLLENGPASAYHRFFDIDWHHPQPELAGKVLAPFLGRPLDQCLKNREIRLTFGPGGFKLAYYDLVFPLKFETYPLILALVRDEIGRHGRKPLQTIRRLDAVVSDIAPIPDMSVPEERGRRILGIKSDLWRLYRHSAVFRQALADTMRSMNDDPADPRLVRLRHALLTGQNFLLACWKTAARRINYRRFFTINELIALRQERTAVFDQTHALGLALIRRGWISGVRIDHIDGLADPGGYLHRLREEAKSIYLVVEKILAPDEPLPAGWPVQGTTGYDFADRLNGVFCQGAHEAAFDRLHRHWCPSPPDFASQSFAGKRQFLQQEMAGDVENLARLLQSTAPTKIPDLNRLQTAVTLFLSAFPVYRTYIGPDGPDRPSRRRVRRAAATALAHSPCLKKEIAFLRTLLLNRPEIDKGPALRESRRQAVARLQQLCAPAAAKGVEDTALYRHHRLISLNEVGGHPDRFGCTPRQFHDFIRRRRKDWPHTMNGSATHDSKRGEDVRARINVLSEMPERWRRQVQAWHRLNRRRQVKLNGRWVPAPSTAYFIYQTLVGAYPLDVAQQAVFAQRVSAYLVKASREAKTATSWIAPQPDYEAALGTFVHGILNPGPDNLFLKQMHLFVADIAHYALFNILSQTLIKITAPGVPDFYQGTELPVLHLVDPDNRRPVDFALRKQWLAQIRKRHRTDPSALIADLLADRAGGRIKLFLVYAALHTRRQHSALYRHGGYLPLTVTGRFADHVIAFARHHAGAWSLTLAPRFVSGLVKPGTDPVGPAVWGDTVCRLPAKAPRRWVDAFTLRRVEHARSLPIGDALHFFPAALLTGG